jgi:uncharacterized protein (DUF488 family)
MWTESAGVIGIGYQGRTPEELSEMLLECGVTTLVDVRLNAISRKRGFSKRALSEHLDSCGITYLHRPALGNPRDNSAAYGETDSAEGLQARDRFKHVISAEAGASAIRELVDLATRTRVAVFCYEDSELNCHRHEVLHAARELMSELRPAG